MSDDPHPGGLILVSHPVPRPDGLILLSHPVHWPVSSNEMLSALSHDLLALPRSEVAIDAVRFPLEQGVDADWSTAGRTTVDQIKAKLISLVDRCPNYHVAYFGEAPIPLALLAGFQLGTWTRRRVFQRRHDTQSWRWLHEARTVGVSISGVPSETIRAPGDVVVCVQTSHRIDMQDVRAAVGDAVSEVTISTDPVGPDALASEADVEHVAAAFTDVLDRLIERCPNVGNVHLFISAPVGMTFRLGTCISATKHQRVTVYYYSRHTEPKYTGVFSLQDFTSAEVELSEDDLARAANLRQLWEDERVRLAGFGRRLVERGGGGESWLRSAFPGLPVTLRVPPHVEGLPPLSKVGLDGMRVQLQRCSHAEFKFNAANREWELGDAVLVAIERRVPANHLPRAGRLFLLHEILHEVTQMVTTETGARIGRFPRVLEQVDYLADLWAMTHECALAKELGEDGGSFRATILSCIDVALASFWGFDGQGAELHEIQVRRLHRYLIWTWQKLRIERTTDEAASVFEILFDRPVIELAGPALRARGDRTYFDLNPTQFDMPEVALLDGNRVRRCGDAPSTPLAALLQGFRQRDNGLIRDALAGVYGQVRKEV